MHMVRHSADVKKLSAFLADEATYITIEFTAPFVAN
jgi:hypothetical protein